MVRGSISITRLGLVGGFRQGICRLWVVGRLGSLIGWLRNQIV